MNLYTSAAPVLVAIPAVIVVLRIYPLILRGLLRGAARGRSATGFLGLAIAARAALTRVLPAFALVLAITVAAFAGMVRNAVTHGEISRLLAGRRRGRDDLQRRDLPGRSPPPPGARSRPCRGLSTPLWCRSGS